MVENIEMNSSAGTFPASVIRPEGPIKGGLIVIHEVWGLTDHIKSVAERFAKEGYVVIAPDLLSELNISSKLAGELQRELFDPELRNKAQPKMRELMTPMQAPDFGSRTVTKLKSSFDYLMNQKATNGKVGVVGYCFGGTYSFSLAVDEPRLKAAVPFYGHADFSVEELGSIACPILAFYGEKDENLMNSLPDLKEKMKKAGVDFRSIVYPDCGHAFFNDTNKFAYNAAAATDAWQKATDFLAKNFI